MIVNEKLENEFIENANRIGKELFNHFSSNLFEKIALKSFKFSEGDFNSFTDNNVFANYEKNCKSNLFQEYSNSIKISTSFIKPWFICYFVIKFNEIQYNHFKNALLFNVCCSIFLQNLLNNYSDNIIDFYDFDYCSSILRKAANSLFEFVSYSSCNTKQYMLFSYIEELSILTYEKNKNDGYLLFYPSDKIEKLSFQFYFEEKEKVSKENLKLIRKLLELSNKNEKIGIISDTEYIYGIAIEDNKINHYSLSFCVNNSWKLFYYDNNEKENVICANNRIISMNSDNSTIAVEDFKRVFQSVFLSSVSSEKISQGIKQLIKENKGTIIVISNDAKNLINNYKDLCIRIKPRKINCKNIKKLSSIDGAIIIDEKGICYGFGVILDGLDTPGGDPSRGSRYNSSRRFFNYQKEHDSQQKLLVFVLSDDGNYNIFPEGRANND